MERGFDEQALLPAMLTNGIHTCSDNGDALKCTVEARLPGRGWWRVVLALSEDVGAAPLTWFLVTVIRLGAR